MKTNLKKKLFHKKLLYPVKIYQELPPFASLHNNMYDSDYYRCYCVDYRMYEYSSFGDNWGWYIRFKPFAIPKIKNNILKFLFGKRMYLIETSLNGEPQSHSEYLTNKQAKQRIEFETGDMYDREMYYSHIKYSGFLFKSNKEEKSKKSIFDFMLMIHSK